MGRILVDGAPYHIETFQPYVGRLVGVSDWLEIDQKRITEFGHATNDMNLIHVDPDFARANSPFGGVVAHGFLTLALLTHLSQSAQMVPDGVDYGINLGFERVRFLAPVPVDSFIRMKATVLGCEARGPGRWTFKSRCNIEVKETAKVALSAIWTVLFVNARKSGMTGAELAAAAVTGDNRS
jgi:acyl dehydratase